MRIIAFLCLILTLTSVPIQASEEATIIQSYIEAARGERYGDAAALSDPEDLKRFRQIWDYFDKKTDSQFGETLRRSFFGPDATLESTQKQPDAAFLAAYLKMSRIISSAFGGEMMKADYKILGYVQDGDTQRYMLRFSASLPHPTTGTPVTYADMAIISLRKDENGRIWVRIPDLFFTNATALSVRINEG